MPLAVVAPGHFAPIYDARDAARLQQDVHIASFRSELDGVTKQIPDNLLETRGIARDRLVC